MPLVLTLNPSVPAATVPELIASAKANPGRLAIASGGIGSVQHVAGELFKLMAGVDLLHVPYRGNPRADLIGGQVQLMFDSGDQGNTPADQIGRQRRQSIELAICPSVLDRHVPATIR